jgi:hypothetical protein
MIDDGLSSRINVEVGEPLQISLNLKNLRPTEKIFLSVPHGGDLSRPNGEPLEFFPSATSEKLELDFNPSLGEGAFTISVVHGGETLIIDLWAGSINPLGEPGEPYVPAASSR